MASSLSRFVSDTDRCLIPRKSFLFVVCGELRKATRPGVLHCFSSKMGSDGQTDLFSAGSLRKCSPYFRMTVSSRIGHRINSPDTRSSGINTPAGSLRFACRAPR